MLVHAVRFTMKTSHKVNPRRHSYSRKKAMKRSAINNAQRNPPSQFIENARIFLLKGLASKSRTLVRRSSPIPHLLSRQVFPPDKSNCNPDYGTVFSRETVSQCAIVPAMRTQRPKRCHSRDNRLLSNTCHNVSP